jgi:DNA polymerase
VGEAPGRQEDVSGVPFVGQAGKVLDKGLAKVSLSREDVVVTNAVKCRPVSNRTPESDEIEACSPYLIREIEALDAYVILALGNVAAEALLGFSGITSIRGTWHRLDAEKERWVMPTFHPAYILRKGLDSDTYHQFVLDIQTFAERAMDA